MSINNYVLFILLSTISFTMLGRVDSAGNKCDPRKEEQCTMDNSCQCYCSHLCGFRDKEADDMPVYVPNDPYGNFCYCKPWDRDNYEALCLKQKKSMSSRIMKYPK